LNTGLGWRPFQQYSDLVGVAARWAEPANHNLRDQYVFEGFYRFQLTSQLAVTPDLQWILHPTLNPNTGSLWLPIPTKPPVCNGMIAPRDSWMMPPPCNEMIPPGAPRLLA
jgi:hypothetical protein